MEHLRISTIWKLWYVKCHFCCMLHDVQPGWKLAQETGRDRTACLDLIPWLSHDSLSRSVRPFPTGLCSNASTTICCGSMTLRAVLKTKDLTIWTAMARIKIQIKGHQNSIKIHQNAMTTHVQATQFYIAALTSQEFPTLSGSRPAESHHQGSGLSSRRFPSLAEVISFHVNDHDMRMLAWRSNHEQNSQSTRDVGYLW